MAKVLALYYSRYGHIEKMAEAVAEGARSAGATVETRRVPELVPEEVAKASHFKFDQAAPVANVDELPDHDAIILDVSTRFGNMPAQMKNLLDQTGGLWFTGKLVGKVGSVYQGEGGSPGLTGVPSAIRRGPLRSARRR
jgi:NAD(P)H dehydrogenase (quinone)